MVQKQVIYDMVNFRKIKLGDISLCEARSPVANNGRSVLLKSRHENGKGSLQFVLEFRFRPWHIVILLLGDTFYLTAMASVLASRVNGYLASNLCVCVFFVKCWRASSGEPASRE